MVMNLSQDECRSGCELMPCDAGETRCVQASHNLAEEESCKVDTFYCLYGENYLHCSLSIWGFMAVFRKCQVSATFPKKIEPTTDGTVMMSCYPTWPGSETFHLSGIL